MAFSDVSMRLPWLLVITLFLPFQAGADEMLPDLYLEIVEEAVTNFEPLWMDESHAIPRSGYFDFRKYEDWEPDWYPAEIMVPGNAMVAFCYAVLLTETDEDVFSDANVPRDVLTEHAIKAIRWCCMTSAYVDRPYPYPIPHGYDRRLKGESWVRPLGHRTDVVGWLTLAITKLWDVLDAETKALAEDTLVGTAANQWVSRSWEKGQGGNHDIAKQDLAGTLGAAFLFSNRPQASRHMEALRGFGLDMVSTIHDKASTEIADGKAVREQARGWNLYQDYSSDHHGTAQIFYGSDMIFEGRLFVELMSRFRELPVPEVFDYRGNGFDGALHWSKVLGLPEGEPASVHGVEYDSYYGAGLLAYCYGATLRKDPVAAAFEETAAKLLARHSRAVGVYDYHRNSWGKAAIAYLIHKSCGPRADPISFNEAWKALNGTYHYRRQNTIIHRSTDKWVSFSWDSDSRRQKQDVLCGYVVPSRALAPNLAPLVYQHPRSLVGEFRVSPARSRKKRADGKTGYKFTCDDTGFHTAGSVQRSGLRRDYAFWSYADGPSVLVTWCQAQQPGRVSWSGLPVYFYERDGISGSRRYADGQGSIALAKSGARRSSWWCVDDILGVLSSGGNGQIHIESSAGYNWARTAKGRDQCQAVFLSPIKNIPMKIGDTVVDIAVAIYGDTDHQKIAGAAQGLDYRPLDLPDGWRSVLAPDAKHPGKTYLGVVNFQSRETKVDVHIGFPEGAPILSRDTIANGAACLLSLELEQMESYAETIACFVTTDKKKKVRIRKESPSRYFLAPVDSAIADVTLRYTGSGADAFLVSTQEQGFRKVVSESPDETGAFKLTVKGPTWIEIKGKHDRDEMGPFIEIAEASVNDDGSVSITTVTNDQSAIAAVELFCDNRQISRKTAPPFVWNHRPAIGFHTYYAVATDGSPQANRRRSFKRTIQVVGSSANGDE